MDEKIGEIIGNYRIVRKLGQGAFSEVYLAQHVMLTNRTVAIKFLHSTFNEFQQAQFITEAQILEQLKHPHILPIYDIGFQGKYAYLIMEYASGGSLRDYIEHFASRHLPVESTIKILLQISQALEYAHQQNIIHRDVKPGNILFNSSDDILLADFGLAIILSPDKSEINLDTTGTPAYMAPERQIGEVSKASDQYALGCIAYELLTGRKPFSADDVLEVLRKQKQEIPAPLHQFVPEISLAVEQVVLTSLAKERGQRFASITDFAVALEKAARGTYPRLLIPKSQFSKEGLTTTSPNSTVLFQSSIGRYEELKDFFVTYHNADRFWAEWIAWHLEDQGYTTILPAWDFRAGTDINVEIRKATAKAKYVIALLSPDYFAIREKLEEWNTTLREHAASGYEKLIPIFVRKCEPKQIKLLKSITYIDLVECDETTALQRLLAVVRGERIKPSKPPLFPGNQHKTGIEDYAPFPASQNPPDSAHLTQKVLPLIQAAFARKDWTEVLQKTSPLLNPEDAHTLSSELYHLHGLALFKVGESERASAALKTALELEQDTEKHLGLLQDYTNVLIALGRWNEVLLCADKALQQAPNTFHWLALREQALAQTTAATELRSISQTLIPALQKIEIFFSYSHKDEALRNELEKYLTNLRRQHAIVGWYDGKIGAGREWDRQIEKHINRAHIILLLVSQDFIASDYCYEKEMKRALERHEAGEAYVIPIILRPADWEVTPFGKLQALPTGARPITLWSDRDKAFMDVVKGIQKVVNKLMTSPNIAGT